MELNALIQPDFILDMQRKVLNIPKHFFFSSVCILQFRIAFKTLPAMALSKKYMLNSKKLILHSSWVVFSLFWVINLSLFLRLYVFTLI